MCYAGDRTGSGHGIEELLLVFPGFLAWELNLDVQRPSVGYSVTHDIRFAMFPDVYDPAVSCIKLSYCVIPRHASVLAQRSDYFVL